jgi:hypothetical protein
MVSYVSNISPLKHKNIVEQHVQQDFIGDLTVSKSKVVPFAMPLLYIK